MGCTWDEEPFENLPEKWLYWGTQKLGCEGLRGHDSLLWGFIPSLAAPNQWQPHCWDLTKFVLVLCVGGREGSKKGQEVMFQGRCMRNKGTGGGSSVSENPTPAYPLGLIRAKGLSTCQPPPPQGLSFPFTLRAYSGRAGG